MIQNAGTSSIKRCTRSDNLHPLLHPTGCIVPCIIVHQISQYRAFRMIRKASVLSKKVAKSGRAGGTAFCRGFRGRFPKPCATAHFPRTSEALFADAGGRSWVFRQSEACNQADYRLFYFCPKTKSARFLVFKGKNQHFFPALIAPQRLLKSPPSGRASPVSIACAEVILDL